MQKLKVVVFPNPILTKKASPVSKIGPAEKTLIEQMIHTMYEEGGVGLAAPQVGVSKRIFIASPDGRRGEEMVFVNPVILSSAGEQTGPEGCLSLPGIASEVCRAKILEFECLDRNGKYIRGSATDFLARIIQHELDHLDGKLLLDRVDFNQRQELLDHYQRL